MSENIKSTFQFDNFKIIRSVFEKKEGDASQKINLHFSPKAKYYKEIAKFELFLGLTINDINNLLHIEVDAIAQFTLGGKTEEKDISNYFYVNAPALLFPYIRAYIATLTTLSGYLKPITLPTLNLITLAKQLESNTEII